MVPLTGLEPVRSCPQRILSPRCLPFHHSGVDYRIILTQFSGAVKGENVGSSAGRNCREQLWLFRRMHFPGQIISGELGGACDFARDLLTNRMLPRNGRSRSLRVRCRQNCPPAEAGGQPYLVSEAFQAKPYLAIRRCRKVTTWTRLQTPSTSNRLLPIPLVMPSSTAQLMGASNQAPAGTSEKPQAVEASGSPM